MNNNTDYEWILQTTFTASARAKILPRIEPYLFPLVHPGDEILDLCCGSGFVSFWFDAQGAKVTGLDFAPYMIALAMEEAIRRHSTVEFIEADIFARDFGQDRFDLISCIDSISDFPLSDFAGLGRKIASALRPEGRFIVQYTDGVYPFMQGNAAREGVYQEVPERITFRFKEYLPEIGARGRSGPASRRSWQSIWGATCGSSRSSARGRPPRRSRALLRRKEWTLS